MRSEVKRETRSKYRNIPTEVPALGRKFASKLEARYAEQLELERKAGAVLWWVPQASFVLEGGIVYRADFLVVRPWYNATDPCEPGWGIERIEIVDCKGFMTQTSFNKLRQMQDRYGIVVQCWDGKALKPYYDVSRGRAGKSKARSGPPPG